MKVFIVIFSLFVTSFAFSQSAGSQDTAETKPRSADEMVSYIDQLVEKEAQPVTCDTILEAAREYVDLSQTNQNLLTVSANRLLKALPSDTERTSEETEALSADITRAVSSIEESQIFLSDKAFYILDALPGCLKE